MYPSSAVPRVEVHLKVSKRSYQPQFSPTMTLQKELGYHATHFLSLSLAFCLWLTPIEQNIHLCMHLSFSTTPSVVSQIENKELSIIISIKTFYKYLCARRFLLNTDHRLLVSIFGPKTLLPSFVATHLHHWCTFLSQLQYDVIYRKSEQHGNADCLSRLVAPSPTQTAE